MLDKVSSLSYNFIICCVIWTANFLNVGELLSAKLMFHTRLVNRNVISYLSSSETVHCDRFVDPYALVVSFTGHFIQPDDVMVFSR